MEWCRYMEEDMGTDLSRLLVWVPFHASAATSSNTTISLCCSTPHLLTHTSMHHMQAHTHSHANTRWVQKETQHVIGRHIDLLKIKSWNLPWKYQIAWKFSLSQFMLWQQFDMGSREQWGIPESRLCDLPRLTQSRQISSTFGFQNLRYLLGCVSSHSNLFSEHDLLFQG